MLKETREGRSLKQKDEKKKIVKKSSYDKPLSLKEIKSLYGTDLYKKLSKDPVHKWRAINGIELLHEEPTEEEFERILANWQEMDDAQKRLSDEQSIKLFGKNNLDRVADIKNLYKARKFVEAVRRMALKKKLNFFLVTDGASGISNNGNPAVKNAREAQIKWELENGADPYEDWGQKKASKSISFPKEEIDSLKGKDYLYTTRVSDDFDKYSLGDSVNTPWGDKYTVTSEDIYDDVKKHKFYKELTPKQKKLLKVYDKICW